ncbi:hypothetical protein CVT24_001007 [Panaeolus cyanescens]|uniref:Endo-1,4-beta-xylanase n=1 Tax=Panaeolus cyanescens TaxID=181874 RepID=A0A409YTL0_9AGAR|nr:hypothetical protein CVT24_001007 [Panaeolus cyanescens]
MLSIKSNFALLLFILTSASNLSPSTTPALAHGARLERRTPPNTSGPYDPYFYTWWTDGNVDAVYSNGAGGQFLIQWKDNGLGGKLIGGKGFNPGTASRVIRYSGTYNPSASSEAFLAVRGWTRNPLVEYYIIDAYSPSIYPLTNTNVTQVGTVDCDDASYTIYQSQQVGQPSINGASTNFAQYWSVRAQSKTTGTISGAVSVACHANAWARAGMRLGNHDYQIVATEAVGGTGTTAIAIPYA